MALTKVSRGLLSTSIVDNGNATAITIDSSENVGIGTSSPDRPLDITDATTDGSGGVVLHSYLPTLELDDISGGGTSFILQQDGANTLFKHDSTERMRIDSSGNLNIYGTDNRPLAITSFATASAGAGWDLDATSGNGVVTVSTGGTERMRIDSSGNVGIGTSSPTADLHVRRAADGTESNAHFKISGGASTYTAHHWLDATAYYIGQNSTGRRVRIYSGTESSGVNLNANATSWGTFSDERLKYDVEPVENAVESLSNLRTVKYRLKDVDSAEDKKKLGLMAQDLVGVLDEVIDPVKKTGDDTEYMSVRYTELIPVLVKAIQEQQTLIESLTARIAALEE